VKAGAGHSPDDHERTSQIDMVLEAGDGVPGDVGEPSIGPIAAMANALFALTDKRVRRLPMTPQRLAQG